MSTNNPANTDDSAASPTFRASTAALTALVLVLLVIVLMLGLAYFSFAQQIPQLTPLTFENALAKWDRDGPASYTMDIKLVGTRPNDVVHIQVVEGVPVAMTRDGNTPSKDVWNVFTVPGMFATIKRELELAEDSQHKIRLGCKFDTTYSYPAIFHCVNPASNWPDFYWEVTHFKTGQ